ncbi:sulfurtransferase [Paenibacillus sp. NEAU-GSW1]|uniref:sulfurtransferase n=1 Tax=Paenibacillus sp. NEAU-GSW1 TaxID=2682486 RepID=UPI0012E233E8|nr:sulfurtransferase [Paenibacillus sp. NEAU-GSW1]MUT65947.1 sulfurtransferase [Paenibacillus sp. NEAU-GSW1]
MSFKNIVDAEWVRSRQSASEQLVIADVRFSPKDAQYGRNAYDKGHLPGAVFVDFKADLTDPAREHGGRSPLPSPERLAGVFGGLGIDQSTTVVVYEDGNGPAASRLWWILKYFGHDNVYVLDGGYSAWTAVGFPVTDEPSALERRTFVPAVRPELLAEVADVRAASERRVTSALVDSRDANQYLGLEAPFDPIAGRIPGAVNYFWKDALNEDGSWKSPEQLRERFGGVASASDEIIVYCNSGISATPNVLALQEAGFTRVKLYAGSWSDWISYEENPIATGEE